MALLPNSLSRRLRIIGRKIRRVNRVCAILLLLPFHLVFLALVFAWEVLFLNHSELIESPWPIKNIRALAIIINAFQMNPVPLGIIAGKEKFWDAGWVGFYPVALLYILYRLLLWAFGFTSSRWPGAAGAPWVFIPWNGGLLAGLVWSDLFGTNFGLVWEPLILIIIPFLHGLWNRRLYGDLQVNSSMIRLITVLPGDDNEIIKCNLHTVDIGHETPNYEALSYSWGGHLILRRVVHINGRPFFVTDSLFRALRSLRHISRPRVFWIDQICINQSDGAEKSDQVSKMGFIYNSARSVTVWLGAAPKVPPLLKLEECLSLFEGDEDQSPGRAWLLHSLSKTVWDLMGRRWWNRVWVVQEVTLARRFMFRAGDIEVKLSTLQQLAAELSRRGLRRSPLSSWGLMGFLPFVNEYKWVSSIETHRSVLWLVAVADWFGASDATDPRDKLYGFLGLVNTSVIPTYSSEVYEVTGEITFQCIWDSGYLDVLALAHGVGSDPMPSWAVQLQSECPKVPLWSIPTSLRRQTKPKRPYSASGNTVAKAARVDIRQGLLRLNGWRADKVLDHSNTFPSNDEKKVLALRLWLTDYYKHFPSANRKKIENVEQACLVAESFFNSGFRFMRTISAGQVDSKDSSVTNAWTKVLFAGTRGHTMSEEECAKLFETFPWNLIVPTCSGRRFFVTAEGYMGIGPEKLKRGDEVHIFLGSAVPLLTRDGFFGRRLVGQAYIDGLMHLEDRAQSEERPVVKEIELY